MTQREAIALTPRQREVIDLLDQRVLIKDIAGRLGISESRVNHYIRELKRKCDANSLPELVAKYRSGACGPCKAGLRFPTPLKNELPPAFPFPQSPDRVDESELVLTDVAFRMDVPWAKKSEPRVVPQVLDGDNAVLHRMAVIAIILIAILGSIVFAMDAFDGMPKLAHLVRQLF